jgi:hypothetical protein
MTREVEQPATVAQCEFVGDLVFEKLWSSIGSV